MDKNYFYKITLLRTIIVADQCYSMISDCYLPPLERNALGFITLLGTELKGADRQVKQAEITLKAENITARAKDKAINYADKLFRTSTDDRCLAMERARLFVCSMVLVSTSESLKQLATKYFKGAYRPYAIALRTWASRIVSLNKAIEKQLFATKFSLVVDDEEMATLQRYVVEYTNLMLSMESLEKATRI